MRTAVCAGIAAVVVSTGAAAEETRRELDAHEHGHGSLTVAIEQGRMQMELEVPGADIVGFEYAPKSDEDIAAVEKAKAVLAQPLTLFVVPEAAGCAVEGTEVALVTDDHGDEHDDHEGEASHDEHDDHDEHADDDHHEDEHTEDDHHEGEHEDEARHAEFHAEYELVCASPDALSSINFAYFDAFAGAEELEVGVITEATQALYEVGRDDPTIDLPAVR